MIIVYAAVLLGILIFVHEVGHFLVAKMVGVKVLKFSLGFGPKIVGLTAGETEYRISAFPLGGYVKMLGEEPGEELPESEKHRAYNYQPVWKRFAIVFFGPLFNLCFAAVIFFFIFLTGVPSLYPDIGTVAENSPAARAGMMPGDRVVQINASPVQGWEDMIDALEAYEGGQLAFTVQRNGATHEFSIVPEKRKEKSILGDEEEVWDLGITPLVRPVVGSIVKGSPAEQAGIRKGDTVVDIGGKALRTWQDMTEVIHQNPEKPLAFTVMRDDERIDMTITPEKKMSMTPSGEEKEVGLIGVGPERNDFTRKFPVFESARLGVRKTWEMSVLTVMGVVKLIQRIIPAETIGGPILIAQMAGQQAAQGALNFFMFMAVISINLGVINLFPIPVLDGGHLFFLMIEAVRKRPISEKAMFLAQRVGLALLLTLMVFAVYNDVMRLVTGKMLPQ